MRWIVASSEPPPEHPPSKKRSPLSGSTTRLYGHRTFDATLRMNAPVVGSSSRMAPVLKSPVVATRAAYRRPSLPTAGQPSVGPMFVSRLALDTAPPAAPSLMTSPVQSEKNTCSPRKAGVETPGQPLKLMPPKLKGRAANPVANGVTTYPFWPTGVGAPLPHKLLLLVNVTTALPGTGRSPSVTSAAV